MEVTHYEVLGITSQATLAQVKKAYRDLLLITHPDKHHRVLNSSTHSKFSISQLQEAYFVLVDPKLRKEYDAYIEFQFKKQGLSIQGDGLDEYSLDKFCFDESRECFEMDCPRCQVPAGFTLSEDILNEQETVSSTEGSDVVIQCSGCSLWVKVKYCVFYE